MSRLRAHRQGAGAAVSEPRLTKNAARCKRCGVTLESKHRHDFVECVCGNFVDGGLAYLRRGGNPDDLDDCSEYEKPSIEHMEHDA